MKKKEYATPSMEIVELQGDIVMAAASNGNRIVEGDESGNSDVTINVDVDNMGSGSQRGAMSGGYFNVWDDEE